MPNEDNQQRVAGAARRGPWFVGGLAVIIVATLIAGPLLLSGDQAGAPTPSDNGVPTPGDSVSAPPETPPPSSPAPTQPTPSANVDPFPEPEETTTAPRTTKPALPLEDEAEPTEGLRVALTSIKPFMGTSSVPGEVAGPALEITVRVDNLGEAVAETEAVIVNVYYGGDRSPANILVTPREDLPLSVAPGKHAVGVYAFSVPENQRDRVVVEVDLSVDLPVVLFEGPVK